MSRLYAFVLSLMLPCAVWAQDWPAFHAVVDVAQDDVLNVRSAPSGSSEIIGELGPNQTGIEVIRRDESGKWGLVNSGERAGWAFMRYLEPMPGGAFPDHDRLSCGGTEPFWGLDLASGYSAEFSSPEGTWSVQPTELLKAWGRRTPFAFTGQSPERLVSAVITPESCNDGMSDREFGLSITMITETPGDVTVLSGCCALGVGQ
ncbi:SH3 domain-containing protein [Pacificoceanicola onchidii]|uniref:SH3 domain-containing protein n=1 Tax=Pacificoceanicola onchidii TaxID=2562685 RepID=UPI0010A3A967|nr:SH3 domain-containing protein [Pacificoceanicola onchidii]